MFSIVIPLYNKSASIAHTIQSIIDQTFQQFEIVVVDDGSTDCSATVVEAINDDRIRLIRKENGGVCSARNRGIQEAKYDYIALLDADDLWDKDYLVEMTKMISDFPEAMMWGINFAEVTHKNKLVRKLATGLPDGYRGYVDNYFELASKGRVSDLFCSSSVVIRKKVFNEAGAFDVRIKYAEDTDMWWRIIARNRVAFYDRYMVFYQFDAENRALNKSIPLEKYLPFYVDKYSSYKDCPIMYNFAMRWAANHLKPYMECSATRNIAFIAGKKIDLSVLPLKYKYIFGYSQLFGIIIYKITELINKYKNGK